MQFQRFIRVSISLMSFAGISACSGAPEAPTPATRSMSKPMGANQEAPDGKNGTTPIEPANPSLPPVTNIQASKLNLTVSSDAAHDALKFTYGIGKLALDSTAKGAKIKTSRSIVLKKGITLGAEEKALATRLCKDIGVSSSQSAFAEAVDFTGEEIFLVWRSHFAADVKTFLADYQAKNGEALRCALNFTLDDGKGASAAFILLDPAAAATDLVGSKSIEDAKKEGVILALAAGTTDLQSHSLEAIVEAAKIQLKVQAINSSDAKIEAVPNATLEQCYLVAAGGTSQPYNPKSMSGASYALTATVDVAIGALKARAIAGRTIQECGAVKAEAKDKQVDVKFSCEAYFAIKDKGLESGCSWELPVANKLDSENSISLAVNLNKLTIKTRDGSKIDDQTAETALPISGINDIRDGKVNVSQLSKGQAQLLEDALDLWIALDETSYRARFFNYINLYNWEQCSADANARFNSKAINWCTGGPIKESQTAKRYNDPYYLIYRAMVTWHETLHTRNIYHDFDEPKYEPCAGTAQAAHIFVSALNCKLDYCKNFKAIVPRMYTVEQDYNFQGDKTGRRTKGLCKMWANELGVSQ